MRKIILFNMMTLDGFFEGSNRAIDWHHVDSEFNDFADNQLNSADAILFGRKTYDLMASYWTTSEAAISHPIIANQMNSKKKIVFSRTMSKAEWNNTLLIKDISVSEIEKLKQQPGKDLIIFGSAELASTFQKLDVIDEYRVVINPIILGQGNPLFKQTTEPIRLRLINSMAFKSGNMLLCYQPLRDTQTPLL